MGASAGLVWTTTDGESLQRALRERKKKDLSKSGSVRHYTALSFAREVVATDLPNHPQS